MKFDKTVANAISKDIVNALKAVEEKYGVTIRSKGGRFSPEIFDVKLELVAKGEAGEVQTAEALAWTKYAVLFGLKTEDLGKHFKHGGETFEVSGIKPNSRKFPVLAKKLSNGKTFKFPIDAVKRALIDA